MKKRKASQHPDRSETTQPPKATRQNARRRQLLKGTAAGVTGVALWKSPVVESVIMPAHAQTTPTPDPDPDPDPAPQQFSYSGTDLTQTVVQLSQETPWYARLSEILIPSAHAGKGPGNQVNFCVDVDGDIATVRFTPNSGMALFAATLSTDGTPGAVSLTDHCDDVEPGSGGPVSARVVGYTLGDASIIIQVTGSRGASWQVTLSSGSGGCASVVLECLPV